MRVQRVAFLAAGWALASRDSHGTSVALETEEGVFLVDAGGAVAKGLVRSFGLAPLTDVYLTHEHPDHTWGFPGLVHCLRFAGARPPLTVHGPPGAIARARGALEALGVTAPFDLRWQEVPVEDGQDEHASWTPADHTVPTLSFRFDDVVVCGDTRPSMRIVELARGASLLVHEGSHTDEARTHSAGHSTPADAGRIAAQAGVATLALIHVHPSLALDKARRSTEFSDTATPVDGDVLERRGRGWAKP